MSYDKCVRCGSCLQYCPMFDVTGEEQFSPRVKAYLLQVMDQIEDDEELGKEFRRLLFQCSLCGRCEETCSSGVDLLKVWHEQRAKAIEMSPEEFAYLEPLKDALRHDGRYERPDLIQRLQAETCVLCGFQENCEVHHIRKMVDLKKRWAGRKEKPKWVKLMIAIHRKTLVACHQCHMDIHAGRPTPKSR